jgi:hypothetical protein
MTLAPEPYKPFQSLQAVMAQTMLPERARMERVLNRAAKWRQQLLVNTFRARQGNTVFSGPFAGMDYAMEATEGALLPRLIGCYEAELHPVIAELPSATYEHIIDVGCAEGYYAVGLARLLPHCKVHAHDIATSAQKACRHLAEINAVADRVTVQGVFDGHALAQHRGRQTLVVCDIEGAEDELLDPVRYPAFAEVDLIVEVHECFQPGLVQKLQDRFAPTHDIEWIGSSVSAARTLPAWVQDLSHLDQVLCTWEWRQGPTPWGVMRRRR